MVLTFQPRCGCWWFWGKSSKCIWHVYPSRYAMGGMRHLGMTVEKVLVSSCLLGQAVRYDGGHNLMESELVQTWLEQGRIVAICPECAGGLPTPRPPAERIGQRILTAQGEDVTHAFSLGADLALKLAQQHGIKVAILKARSPSCGNRQIYDGQLICKTVNCGTRINGWKTQHRRNNRIQWIGVIRCSGMCCWTRAKLETS